MEHGPGEPRRCLAHRPLRLLRYSGSRFIVAASVALLAGLCVDRVLLALLLPVAAILYGLGVVQIRRQRHVAAAGRSILKPSLARGLNVWRRPSLRKSRHHS